MTSFVLVMYIYAGMWSKNDSTTMTNVPGFSSEQSCIEAGNKGKKLVAGTKKDYEFVCIQVK